MTGRPANLTTSHYAPWALIRRAGDTVGKRPSTRMAFLVGTVAPNGTAVALTGYVMNDGMTNWTKRPVRIEFSDIIKDWRHQPAVAEVRRAKLRMPKIESEHQRRRAQFPEVTCPA